MWCDCIYWVTLANKPSNRNRNHFAIFKQQYTTKNYFMLLSKCPLSCTSMYARITKLKQEHNSKYMYNWGTITACMVNQDKAPFCLLHLLRLRLITHEATTKCFSSILSRQHKWDEWRGMSSRRHSPALRLTELQEGNTQHTISYYNSIKTSDNIVWKSTPQFFPLACWEICLLTQLVKWFIMCTHTLHWHHFIIIYWTTQVSQPTHQF